MGDQRQRLDGRFAKFWAASTTSALGSGLATIAAPLLVASRTNDPLIVSAGFGVSWLPWLLFSLPGGVLVDRVDRRKLMVFIDAVRVVAMAVLSLAIVAGHASIALLYAVLFVVNTGEVVFRSASQSMIPSVVPRSLLERANGWLAGGVTLTQGMLAGPLSGFLFAVAVSIPFLVNAGTYAASAVLIALVAGVYRSGAVPQNSVPSSGVPSSADGEPDGRTTVRGQIVEGFRWLIHQRLLRTMAVLIGLLNLTLTAAVAVLVLLAKDRLHLGAVGYGLLLTCMSVGGIVGSVIGDRLIKWVTATWTIRIGLLIEAGMHLALAASRSAYFIGFALFAFGVHGSLWSIAASSLRQRLTPPEMLGRVSSSTLFISAGGNCVGAVLGGVVAADFGITAPYWVGFVVAVVVTAVTWRVFNRADVARAYAEPEHRDSVPQASAAA
ncbi:MFS transporter [Rugosimonospora africana]|uniref:MFS transporter n=1 Tax=Rugosimonospora africana TaxID=556532 RepID=A0A8J3QXA2_9ACTN|nr:MFS transporter [Rugosimonospora africana]